MPKSKIYTRTGDKGTTSIYTGKRIPKNDPIILALGEVDEANSAIGAAISFFPNKDKRLSETKTQLEIIQHALFDVGAAIATPRTNSSENKLQKTRFGHEAVDLLEHWIDAMEEQLPELHTFILPGGHPSGALLHLSRSMIRRAERKVLSLFDQGEVNEHVLMYLNRLSDYLFVASRYVNHLLEVPETIWKPHKTEKMG